MSEVLCVPYSGDSHGMREQEGACLPIYPTFPISSLLARTGKNSGYTVS